MSRKCPVCENKDIRLDEDVAFVYFNRKYYHPDCLIQHLMTLKRHSYTHEEAKCMVADLLLHQESEEETKFKEQKFREKLIDCLVYEYRLKSSKELPQHFFIELAKVNDGTSKKTAEPISNHDLYVMYRNKIKELNNIAATKKIQGYNRAMWDLAIILGKYPEYRKWKLDKMKIDADIQHFISMYRLKAETLEQMKAPDHSEIVKTENFDDMMGELYGE